MTSDLVIIYSVNNRGDLTHTDLYAYSTDGRLTNVKKFSTFIHIGGLTVAERALITTASSGTATSTSDDEEDDYYDEEEDDDSIADLYYDIDDAGDEDDDGSGDD